MNNFFFFQSTVFLYFTKVVAVIYSSMDTVFFRWARAAINCVYTIYLTDIWKYWVNSQFQLQPPIPEWPYSTSSYLLRTAIFWNTSLSIRFFNTLSANITKLSNTLKQFGKLPTNCLSVFDHFVGLALKGLRAIYLFHHSNFSHISLEIVYL